MVIKVTCQVESYDEPARPSISVHSHWNIHRFVVLEVMGQTVTVKGNDLIAAINNCMNSGSI